MQTASNARRSRGERAHGWKRVLLLLGALLAALVLVGLWSADWGTPWEETRRVFRSPEALREYVLDFGRWAPAAIFLAQAAQVIVPPIPGGVTTALGPLVFGPWIGTALIAAGGVVGSIVLFALVRRWGPPLAVRLVGRRNFERFSGAFDDEKGALLFVVMLVPLVPDDVAVAVAGLSAVSFRRFVILVALGRLPGWVATAFVAADLVGRSTGTLVTVGLAVAAAAALVLVYRKRLESWLLRRARARREHWEQGKEKSSPMGVSRSSWTSSRITSRQVS